MAAATGFNKMLGQSIQNILVRGPDIGVGAGIGFAVNYLANKKGYGFSADNFAAAQFFALGVLFNSALQTRPLMQGVRYIDAAALTLLTAHIMKLNLNLRNALLWGCASLALVKLVNSVLSQKQNGESYERIP